jgi:hypothetical protein
MAATVVVVVEVVCAAPPPSAKVVVVEVVSAPTQAAVEIMGVAAAGMVVAGVESVAAAAAAAVDFGAQEVVAMEELFAAAAPAGERVAASLVVLAAPKNRNVGLQQRVVRSDRHRHATVAVAAVVAACEPLAAGYCQIAAASRYGSGDESIFVVEVFAGEHRDGYQKALLLAAAEMRAKSIARHQGNTKAHGGVKGGAYLAIQALHTGSLCGTVAENNNHTVGGLRRAKQGVRLLTGLFLAPLEGSTEKLYCLSPPPLEGGTAPLYCPSLPPQQGSTASLYCLSVHHAANGQDCKGTRLVPRTGVLQLPHCQGEVHRICSANDHGRPTDTSVGTLHYWKHTDLYCCPCQLFYCCSPGLLYCPSAP